MQGAKGAVRHMLAGAMLLITGILAAQSERRHDSLLQVFEHDTNYKARVWAGIKLSGDVITSDPQRTVRIGGQVMHLLDSLQQAGAMSDSLADIHRMIQLQTLGIAYSHLGDVQEELRLALQNLKIADRLGIPQKQCMALEKMGSLLLMQGNREEAYRYFHRALAIAERSNNTYRLALEYGNIGAALGETDPDSMLWYFRRSLEVMGRPDMVDREGAMGWMLNNIGNVLEDRGELDSALFYYERSLALRRSIDHRLGQYLVHSDMAELLVKQGRLQEGLEHANTGIRIAEENGFHQNLHHNFRVRSEVLARLGRYPEAYWDHRRYVQERDSIENERNTKQVVQQTMRYEYGREQLADSLAHEAELTVKAQEVRRQKAVRNGFMGGFALVALFAGIFLVQRNRIGKARERSDELLLNILPEEVAEELKAKGEAEAVHIDQVTVLFTDFKGFTAMSEKVTPKQLVHDLHECFSAFDNICEKHGLEKIKTIGDAYMAAGGLPTPNTTHATDVIQAAFEMRDFIAEGKARKIATALPYFEIRIGIHTGPVVAGIVGVKKFQYDIWGDTVNTASRMESSGEVGKVNISEATYWLLVNGDWSMANGISTLSPTPIHHSPAFVFTPRGKVQAKGKGELEMYFVERTG
ncbi:MAG: tetratricopeptide repeat protein [Flavobacteriales bacterium]|nr:tetratricopeptide repeat protein [Flavobacteriales bacterium]